MLIRAFGPTISSGSTWCPSNGDRFKITLDQYRAGTVSYLNVTIAQTAALARESNLLSVRDRQLTAVNLLLKNIGGRWHGV